MASTDTLVSDSECIEQCVPVGMRLPVLITIFAKLANVSLDIDSLISGALCVENCIPMGMQVPVLISLAQQIVAGGGGGGGGGSCLFRSVGPPVVVPAAGCPVALNFDDAGGFWWYDTASATWIQFG